MIEKIINYDFGERVEILKSKLKEYRIKQLYREILSSVRNFPYDSEKINQIIIKYEVKIRK